MNVLKTIEKTASDFPDRVAFRSPQGSMTYGELWRYAGNLAAYIQDAPDFPPEVPVPVWGHKSPWMLVCFLGLVRSGHGYCPLDFSIPHARVEAILEALPPVPLLATQPFDAQPLAAQRQVLDLEKIQDICRADGKGNEKQEHWVSGDEVFYIIFTSGSTGVPKGVMISERCLSGFLDWSVTLLGEKLQGEKEVCFLNQAPFSFDLSVMDLYTCMAVGGTLECLTKEVQGEYRLLLKALGDYQPQVWVSTPSFAEVCLADPGFNGEALPELSCFLFCGETLTTKTARRLKKAFPLARVVNTYGPTESTVAVTGVEVNEEILALDPLPIGRPRPGTRIEIWGEEGPLPEGTDTQMGEVVILGDTVALGYYQRPDLTEKAFFDRKIEEGREEAGAGSGSGVFLRGYHTGDAGYLKDGMLYYGGRLDLQVKLHGYRIELGDIEGNLEKVPGVLRAVVLANAKDGKVRSLTGYLVADQAVLEAEGFSQDAFFTGVREGLSALVPAYMVPKKLILVDAIPMTANGKVDRRALAGR